MRSLRHKNFGMGVGFLKAPLIPVLPKGLPVLGICGSFRRQVFVQYYLNHLPVAFMVVVPVVVVIVEPILDYRFVGALSFWDDSSVNRNIVFLGLLLDLR